MFYVVYVRWNGEAWTETRVDDTTTPHEHIARRIRDRYTKDLIVGGQHPIDNYYVVRWEPTV
jgi:hypothetical protein